MEASNENDPQDDAVIVRNPMHCTALITKDVKRCSPFLSSIGYMSDYALQRIKRSALGSTRSPWKIKNLCKRLERSVQHFYRKMLDSEATIVQKFNHQSIAGAVTLDRLDLYKRELAMEYCTHSLAETLSERYTLKKGPLEAFKAIKIALATLGALDYLHTNHNMMHGDIKSFNILVDETCQTVKLCGFGNAPKVLNESGTLPCKLVSVGIWSAPEVLEHNGTITPKADVFSFGLVIFEMLSCMPPHTFPGIMDYVIAAPKELRELRNSQKMNDYDALDAIKHDSVNDKAVLAKAKAGSVFARKRVIPPTLLPNKEKKVKHDEVIIDLVDEEEPVKDESVTRGISLDGIGKENKPMENENNPSVNDGDVVGKDSSSAKEKDAIEEESTVGQGIEFDGKETSTGKKENGPAENETNLVVNKETDIEKVPPVLAETEKKANEQQAVVSEAKDTNETTPAPIKVRSDMAKIDTSPPNAPDRNIAESKPAEIVMVYDSSDEENCTPIKSYELDSSESLVNDDDMDEAYPMPMDDDPYSGPEDEDAFDDTEDFYDAPEEEQDPAYNNESDEGSDMDGNFLNYGCLGTRPPIPSEIVFGKEYDKLLDMFYVCTIKNVALRPSAAQILKAYEANKEDVQA